MVKLAYEVSFLCPSTSGYNTVIIKVEEENYELKEIKEVEVIGGITENIIVKKIKPYEIEVKKYISKIKLNNNGKEIEY